MRTQIRTIGKICLIMLAMLVCSVLGAGAMETSLAAEYKYHYYEYTGSWYRYTYFTDGTMQRNKLDAAPDLNDGATKLYIEDSLGETELVIQGDVHIPVYVQEGWVRFKGNLTDRLTLYGDAAGMFIFADMVFYPYANVVVEGNVHTLSFDSDYSGDARVEGTVRYCWQGVITWITENSYRRDNKEMAPCHAGQFTIVDGQWGPGIRDVLPVVSMGYIYNSSWDNPWKKVMEYEDGSVWTEEFHQEPSYLAGVDYIRIENTDGLLELSSYIGGAAVEFAGGNVYVPNKVSTLIVNTDGDGDDSITIDGNVDVVHAKNGKAHIKGRVQEMTVDGIPADADNIIVEGRIDTLHVINGGVHAMDWVGTISVDNGNVCADKQVSTLHVKNGTVHVGGMVGEMTVDCEEGKSNHVTVDRYVNSLYMGKGTVEVGESITYLTVDSDGNTADSITVGDYVYELHLESDEGIGDQIVLKNFLSNLYIKESYRGSLRVNGTVQGGELIRTEYAGQPLKEGLVVAHIPYCYSGTLVIVDGVWPEGLITEEDRTDRLEYVYIGSDWYVRTYYLDGTSKTEHFTGEEYQLYGHNDLVIQETDELLVIREEIYARSLRIESGQVELYSDIRLLKLQGDSEVTIHGSVWEHEVAADYTGKLAVSGTVDVYEKVTGFVKTLSGADHVDGYVRLQGTEVDEIHQLNPVAMSVTYDYSRLYHSEDTVIFGQGKYISSRQIDSECWELKDHHQEGELVWQVFDPKLMCSYEGGEPWNWTEDFGTLGLTFQLSPSRFRYEVTFYQRIAYEEVIELGTRVIRADGTVSIDVTTAYPMLLIIRPASEHDLTCPSRMFVDLESGAWYHDSVDYVVEQGLMNGTGSGTTFSPDGTTTRSMIVTILHRISGDQSVDWTHSFTDVEAGSWYEAAVAWAAHNQVVNGTGDGTTFTPDGKITREQFALMMYNFARNYLDQDVTVTKDLGEEFPDAADVSSWVGDAMAWAVEQGLITGKSVDNQRLLDPQGQASRAEAATMIMRFHKWLNS